MTNTAITIPILKLTGNAAEDTHDMVAVEEPMEIRLQHSDGAHRRTRSISVTMRTPGNDEQLALGFLFTEGIIPSYGVVEGVEMAGGKNGNVVIVKLHSSATPALQNAERNFYTTSSCGVCGKASIEAVHVASNMPDIKDNMVVSAALLYGLPGKLRHHQQVFDHTGGLHGCALFDVEGNLLLAQEDVGRHNALDKLVGQALQQNMLPLSGHILMLSGRASFELVQKAAMAGIKIIAAVGAPSSLAIQMADDWGITLAGFLRGERCNIYTGAQRVVI